MSFPQKNKLPEGINGPLPVMRILQKYVVTGEKTDLNGSLFRHIARHMSPNPNSRDDSDRFKSYFLRISDEEISLENKLSLEDACVFFSYSLPELDRLKSSGETALDIAREIINR